MSLVKKAVSKALSTMGIKSRNDSSSSGFGISSKDLAKLTTNTAAKHNGLGSNYRKIIGVEGW